MKNLLKSYEKLFGAAFNSWKGLLCFLWIMYSYDVAHAVADKYSETILVNLLIGMPTLLVLIFTPLIIGAFVGAHDDQ